MAPQVNRFPENPLISPENVKPSREGWEVVATFNAGAIKFHDEILLLVRVAERPQTNADELAAPILDLASDPPSIQELRVRIDDPELIRGDPRLFNYKGRTYLTSISHLRVARSRDGHHFTVEDQPALYPATWNEAFGVEDPRIVELDGRYYVNYTAVSQYGIATALAETRDFKEFTRHGIIFPPENRDVTIFPEKIAGWYACHNRPAGHHIASLDMWAAFSHDLIHWGEHTRVMGTRPGYWDSERIGGGSVPLRTERGWLTIYHGADEQQRYSLGAMLCELDHPERVIARSDEPLMRPEEPYEVEGFFSNVVFTCGTILQGEDELIIYYGAADKFVCGAAVSLSQLLDSLSTTANT